MATAIARKRHHRGPHEHRAGLDHPRGRPRVALRRVVGPGASSARTPWPTAASCRCRRPGRAPRVPSSGRSEVPARYDAAAGPCRSRSSAVERRLPDRPNSRTEAASSTRARVAEKGRKRRSSGSCPCRIHGLFRVCSVGRLASSGGLTVLMPAAVDRFHGVARESISTATGATATLAAGVSTSARQAQWASNPGPGSRRTLIVGCLNVPVSRERARGQRAARHAAAGPVRRNRTDS